MPSSYALKIASSSKIQVYEMKSCLMQAEEVEGCRGLILHDVVMKDFWGREVKVDHLFFRNLRNEDGPISRECLDEYAQKMSKYIQNPNIMNSFSQRPRATWSDPVDGSQFRFPSFVDHTALDHNGSAYALPEEKSSEIYFKNQRGLECSFSVSMGEHPEDVEIESRPEEREDLQEESPEQTEDSIVIGHDSEQDDGEEESVPEQGDCTPEQGEPLEEEVEQNIEELSEVAAAVYSTSELMSGDLTYGAFGMDAATAKVYLETKGDEISSISLQGQYDIFGMKGSIVENVHVSELLTGESVGFALEPGLNPILKLTPGSNFSVTEGGDLTFEYWDGSRYQRVESQLVKDQNGEFSMKLGQRDISYLSVNVRGMSAEGMRVKSFQVR